MSELMFFDSLDELALSGEFAVIDSEVERLYGDKFAFSHKYIAEASEKKKSLSEVRKICSFLLKNGATRKSVLTVIGGGVTLDTAGFASAIYMRGIEWNSVPTTLLAQSDSAVGGKTGVNYGAKNILGAFHSPRKIFFCKEFLNSLNREKMTSGLGEIIKTALLSPKILKFVNENFDALLSGNIEKSFDAARLCAMYKEEICKRDFYDKSLRNELNLGHTVGHAIESLYGISHGESVIWGLQIESAMFRELIEPSFYDIICKLTMGVNAGKTLPETDCSKIVEKMKKDKKNSEGIAFIVPIALGKTKREELDTKAVRTKLNAYFTCR